MTWSTISVLIQDKPVFAWSVSLLDFIRSLVNFTTWKFKVIKIDWNWAQNEEKSLTLIIYSTCSIMIEWKGD